MNRGGMYRGRGRRGGYRNADRRNEQIVSSQRNSHGNNHSDYGQNFWTERTFTEFSMKDTESLVVHLYDQQPLLKNYLRSVHSLQKKGLLSITLVIEKVARSGNIEHSNVLLAVFLDALNTGSLWTDMRTAIEQVPMEGGHELDKSRDWMKKLHNIFNECLQRIPETSTSSHLPIVPLGEAAEMLSFQNKDSKIANLCQQIEELVKFRKECMRNAMTSIMIQKETKKEDDKENEVPMPFGSFKEVSILPTADELHDSKIIRDIRENRVDKTYLNWDHYLDVHFRLLREDFLHPLRQGLNQFLADDQSKRNTDIRVYNNVRILEPVCLMTGVGFMIQFDSSGLKQVNWDHSRRLIFGSLLCLSSNRFDDILFATVVDRDSKKLQRGNVTIKFEDDTNGFRIQPSTSFIMIESAAYFEACRHILKQLQGITNDLMPFKKYLIDLKCSDYDLEPPLYLRPQERNLGYLPLPDNKFNLMEIMKSNRPINVTLTDERTWPLPEDTKFDKSQLEAMRMALSKEVSVIQGPPGTGKTYVGVRIVEALLRNKAKWTTGQSPILVVCLTNHALDQFLEYILALIINGEPPNVVRVGGRARSERMKQCTIREIIQDMKRRRAVPKHIHKPLSEGTRKFFAIKDEMKSSVLQDAHKEDSLLPFDKISRFIKREHLVQLNQTIASSSQRDSGRQIEIWLKLWYASTLSPEEEEELALRMEQMKLEDKKDLEEMASKESKGDQNGEDDDSNSEDFVEVDAEANLAQNERMLEGEELLIAPTRNKESADDHRKELYEHEKKVIKEAFGWEVVQPSNFDRRRAIDTGSNCEPMTEVEATRVKNIHKLKLPDKWRLYQYWSHKFIEEAKEAAQQKAFAYMEACKNYEEQKHELNLHILQSADIIGMTTTGAAKYNYILQRICPKIVVIEEAAEVLESHIVSCLSSGAQQLVLIGDHKQLRPKLNTYELSKHYNLAVSLFERLVKNDFPYVTLAIQHRMRPDISKLVHPHIYEHLVDHDSVKDYPSIKGVGANLLFLNHQALEDSKKDYDQLSHSNDFEADFIVAFCRYLILQGYETSQITILTMYKGQLLKLKKKMPKDQFEGVRVAAVDDFQGEENDIILLSLVRSNQKNNVGFLKEDTRVCVALSRAKWGLYVFGNFEMLRGQVGTPWPDIIEDVQKRGLLSQNLPLYCQNHRNTDTFVSSADDFSKVKEGGCSKICGIRLDCGHACKRMCHVVDMDHKSTQCRELCSNVKPLPCGHKCTRRCYECRDGCKKCMTTVERSLECGHTVRMKCHLDPLKYLCPYPCGKSLSCGHSCTRWCHEPCMTSLHCKHWIPKLLPCGHRVNIPCNVNEADAVCPQQCTARLQCDHYCSGTCSDCQHGRLHQPCSHPCDRTLPCGHACKFPCTDKCPPCKMKCGNYCEHSKCQKKCGEPCTPCMEPCQWQCIHHKCTKKCGEMCNRPRCNKPCRKILECGHSCIGLCGERCPEYCRICHKVKVEEVFFGTEDEKGARFIKLQDCGHVLEVTGMDQWMDQDHSQGKTIEIQFKRCPKCKTEIRRSFRYGNIIKATLKDLESIKTAISANAATVDLKKASMTLRKLRNSLFQKKHCDIFIEYSKKLKEDIKAAQESHNLSAHEASILDVKVKIAVTLGDLLVKLEEHSSDHVFVISDSLIKCNEVLNDMKVILRVLKSSSYLTPQQVSDIETELKRISLMVNWCEIANKIQRGQGQAIPPRTKDQLCKLMQYLRLAGYGSKAEKLTDKYYESIKKVFDDARKKCSGLDISEKEKVEIVKAMGLSQGHWFKCPNGHVYVITECGGATEESTCPDCGAGIGGRSHRLRDDNTLAREMDGARFGAFSEQANIHNFDPQDWM